MLNEQSKTTVSMWTIHTRMTRDVRFMLWYNDCELFIFRQRWVRLIELFLINQRWIGQKRKFFHNTIPKIHISGWSRFLTPQSARRHTSYGLYVTFILQNHFHTFYSSSPSLFEQITWHHSIKYLHNTESTRKRFPLTSVVNKVIKTSSNNNSHDVINHMFVPFCSLSLSLSLSEVLLTALRRRGRGSSAERTEEGWTTRRQSSARQISLHLAEDTPRCPGWAGQDKEEKENERQRWTQAFRSAFDESLLCDH